MKHLCARLLVTAVVAGMLTMVGCVYNNTDLVLNENVCVNLDEYQTTGTFSTFVVADQFKDRLEQKLKENGKNLSDVKSIHMTSATFKTMANTGHDWRVTADIDIARQDVPGGEYEDGPASLVHFNDQSLKALKGAPTDADLDAAGVELVNDALASLVNGDDPRLVLIVNNETVSPTPSESDPMAFKILTCVKFQIVVGSASKAGGKK